MRVVLFCLLLLPLAAAGSAEDPEVTDAGGDSVSSIALLGAVGAELIKGWYEQDGDNVLFRFEVGTLCADTVETIEYRWTATVAGADVAFGADLFGTGGFCTVGAPETSITPTGATTAASMAGNVATLVVPKSAFGDGSDGTVLEGTYGTSRAYVGSPVVWNDADRAPDEGGGRAYTLGPQIEPVEEPKVLHVNVTDAVLVHETAAEAPLDAAYTLSWDGPANATLHWWMEGNGTVDVAVHGPDGALLADCGCMDGTNETRTLTATAGTWNITVNYTAFEGAFRLVMEEAEEGAEGMEPPATETITTTGTGQANVTTNATTEPAVEESPGLPALALLSVLVMLARRHKRQT